MTKRPTGAGHGRRGARSSAPVSSRGEQETTPQGIDEDAPSKPAPGLYVTATPIGNLADVTLRALALLRTADLVVCEDTRVTRRLLGRYRIRAPMRSYHEHNAARVRPHILKRLQEGAVVALVSDAGTPLISDPGYKLVQAAIEAGVAVTTLPGASSVLAALCVSGLPTDRFLFAGFLPPRAAARRRALEGLVAVEATLVFFEAPRRLAAALADMVAVLGPRRAAVARELTKRFEEVRRDALPALAASYATGSVPKGEVVVVVAPPGRAVPREGDMDALLREALAGMSTREAVARVAAALGVPRRRVYARALELGKDS